MAHDIPPSLLLFHLIKPTLYKIGERIKKVEHLPENTEMGIEMINNAFARQKSVIFIYTQTSLFFATRTFAKMDMHISAETLMMDQMAMALQKGSPLLDTMNNALVNVFRVDMAKRVGKNPLD